MATPPPDLESRLRYAEAINRMARVITHDGDPATIRRAMVEIIGETLDVDRTLIYDARLDDEVAEGLCEWLNPGAEGITPTIATYPLAVFIGGINYVHKHRHALVSHDDLVHPALVDDGSAQILHDTMQIRSLLWFPFDVEDRRFFALVFNQVRHRRDWSEQDLAFVAAVADLVSMAHLRIRLAAEGSEREQRNQQLQRLEGLGLLAGGVAHDFNNLLTAILGNAVLVARRIGADGKAQEMLTAIREAAESAGELCKQLLTYSGRVATSMTLLDLEATVRQMAQLIRVSQSPNARIDYELEEGPLWIHGDRVQVQQVLLNLLTNASDALPNGVGRVSIRSSTISADKALAQGIAFVGAAPEGTMHCLHIQDDGVGMDVATIGRIFEPFYTTKAHGHGLGLAAVHGILAAHRAGIGVHSQVGAGTTFTVAFPNVVAKPGLEHAAAPRRQRRANVLLVDDEEIVRNVCKTALVMAGFAVSAVASGESAVDACATTTTAFDVVVLDLGMPGMDGRQTLQALRDAGHRFPVLMVSAYAMHDLLRDRDGDRVAFLQKPFGPDELEAAVVRVLS